MNPSYTPIEADSDIDQNYALKHGTSARRKASRTPRFVFDSSAQSSSVPQFAATPRFVFTQRTSRDEIDISDEGSSPTIQARQRTRAEPKLSKIKPKEVIEDSDEEDDAGIFTGNCPKNEYTGVNGPDGDDDDDDQEMLLSASPSQRQSKRRRLSISSADEEEEKGKSIITKALDHIISSPPSTSSPAQTSDTLASPTFRRVPSTPFQPPAASSATQHSASQKPPRFIFHSSMPGPQSPWPPDTRTEPRSPTTTESLRKPRFALPHTPPRPDELNISALLTSPIPFPRFKQRGRAKPPRAQNLVLGGMASEVRSWILELCTKTQVSVVHSQAAPAKSIQDGQQQETSHHPSDSKYQVLARIDAVQFSSSISHRGYSQQDQARPGRPAPFALLAASEVRPPAASQSNILLFGSPGYSALPRSKKPQRGDWAGIRRGLVWEMEIQPWETKRPPDSDTGTVKDVMMQKWLVGVEWDVLKRGEREM
ncbi:hypothetical protein PRK78_005663 [Emydomyces testavorans]|uniref:Uncharacterized protein n=1 Tax=Emydomyces testavorans TaxID=2070801 RepID=A0AAF0IK93_9EURO|nr:hypothetical protein PRK78_005663 [Emydomyces testavorans]